MKTISSLRDLEDYGFNPLTGEACNLSMRMLVDLTEQGCKLFCECYGLPRVDKQFNENWNPGSVASVMLPYDAWKSLGVFALLSGAHHTVLCVEHGALVGLKEGESYRGGDGDDLGTYTAEGGTEMPWPSCYGKVVRIYGPGSHPHVGTRNVHAMSGRVV
jgi:hypothetical protein